MKTNLPQSPGDIKYITFALSDQGHKPNNALKLIHCFQAATERHDTDFDLRLQIEAERTDVTDDLGGMLVEGNQQPQRPSLR